MLNVEYAEFVAAAGDEAPPHWSAGSLPEELANHPVVNVTWQDALAYVQWLAERTGKPLFADRGRMGEGRAWRGWTAVALGQRPDAARANRRPAGPGPHHPRAGECSPAGDSPCGAADMAGNVWEWCLTQWQDNYATPPDDDPAGDARACSARGFVVQTTIPASCGAPTVAGVDPVGRFGDVGFRVARGSLR